MSQLLATRPRVVAAVGLALTLAFGLATGAVATTLVRSGQTKAVKVAADDSSYSAGGNGYTDIPGMSVTMTVPSNSKAFFLITFSAASSCSASGSCYVQALINGAYVDGSSYALVVFASPNFQTNSMQWVSPVMSAGTYTINIQTAANVGQTIDLASRTLSVLKSTV